MARVFNVGGIGSTTYFFAVRSTAQTEIQISKEQSQDFSNEPIELRKFREAVGDVTPVIIELRDEPGSVMQFQKKLSLKDGIGTFDKLAAYAVSLTGKQNS